MTQLKTAVLFLSLCAALESVSFPGFAFYSGETSVAANAFRISGVSLIRFSANGGTGSMEERSICIRKGSYLPECSLTKEGCHFTGWNTAADGSGTALSDEDDVSALEAFSSPVTLYAQWEPESGAILEPLWNSRLHKDHDHNGVSDRLELAPGTLVPKDPSLRNTTDKTVYAYLLVSIPAVKLSQSSGSSQEVSDIAVFSANPHWTLLRSSVSTSTASRSKYLYRYDTTLLPKGSTSPNPYLSTRNADQSTDLMDAFRIKAFSNSLTLSSSIDITGTFVENTVTIEAADALAISGLTGKGLL